MFKPDIPVVPGTTVINKQIADIDSMDFDQIYSKKREFTAQFVGFVSVDSPLYSYVSACTQSWSVIIFSPPVYIDCILSLYGYQALAFL